MHEFVEAFRFIAGNGQVQGAPGLPTLTHLTVEHLKVSGIAVLISLVLAVPLGAWLGHLHRGSFIAINVGNVGRALPSLAVLAIGVAFLGLGLLNVEVALVVLALPPMLTNAYVGVNGVDRDLVDAARGMGMGEREVLIKVELPLAIPLIFAGIRTSAVFVIGTATITALAGYSGSLGDVIANEPSYHLSGVLGGAICAAVLALTVELALAGVQRMITPKGLRVLSSSD